MINSFLHYYYNRKRKYTTTKYIPTEVFFNYNSEEIIKDVIINLEKTISIFLEALDFIKGERVLITSWIEPSPDKFPIFKRLKIIKGNKRRKENYNIKGIIDCIRFNYFYVIIEKKN